MVPVMGTKGWPQRETGDGDGQVARLPTTFQSLRAPRVGTTLSQVPGTQQLEQGPRLGACRLCSWGQTVQQRSKPSINHSDRDYCDQDNQVQGAVPGTERALKRCCVSNQLSIFPCV